jgi:prevent-host-death family protein
VKTYTYSEARQRLAELLDRARREGRVRIQRRDGQVFVLQPARPTRAPLDVPGVPVELDRGEILAWIRSGRKESEDRLIGRKSSDKSSRRSPQKTRRG